MAISRVGSESEGFAAYDANWGPLNIGHTIPSGATLVMVSATVPANKDDIGGIVWDTIGVNEALTLVHATTSSDSGGDVKTFTYAIVNPTAKSADMRISPVGADNSTISAGVVNYDGTETASVAAATDFHEEDVNNTNSATLVFASAGTGGNLLYAAGGFVNNDADPIALSGTWTDVLQVTDATQTQELILAIAEEDPAAALTMTRDGADNECAGHMLEIIVASGGATTQGLSQQGTYGMNIMSGGFK